METVLTETNRALPEPTKYGDVILWELPVQIAASLFLCEGDDALDIGGNTGGVAIALARQVGQTGRVISFECNPKMIAWMRQDLAINGILNVEIVTDAAYREGGQTLSFYVDDSLYSAASSLYRSAIGKPLKVNTTTIDLVCERRNFRPKIIKIDVEGGEYDVLQGGQRTIVDYRPVIVFEYSGGSSGKHPIECLWYWGYDMYDTNTYDQIDGSYFEQAYSTNVLAVPRDLGIGFCKQPTGEFDPMDLLVGRGVTIIENHIEISGEGSGELECIDTQTGERIALYCAPLTHLQHHSCSAIVLKGEKRNVSMRVRMLEGPGSISIRKVLLSEIKVVAS